MQTNPRLTLDDICEFVNGNGFRPEDWAPEGLPIIRIQNLNGSTEFNYFSGQPKNKWLVQPGDILFAWAGVKGVSFGPTMWKGSTGVLNQHIFRIVPKIEVNPYWLLAALKHVTARIEARAHGFKASLLHVQKADITEQMIEVPPLAQQRRIAEILRSWDEAIETTERLIATKERRLSGIAGRILLPFMPNNEKDHEDGWTARSLGNIFEEYSVTDHGLSADRVITVGKYAIRLQSEHFKRSVASSDLSAYKLLRVGDFAYDPMSAYYGAIGRYTGNKDGIVSPAYRVLKLHENMDAGFIAWLIKSHYVRFQLEARSSQNNKEGKRRLLQRDDFNSIRLRLPPQQQQAEIAEKLNTFRRDIEGTRALQHALKRQKRGLMQKLLTGEWRVPLHDSEVDELAERTATEAAA